MCCSEVIDATWVGGCRTAKGYLSHVCLIECEGEREGRITGVIDYTGRPDWINE